MAKNYHIRLATDKPRIPCRGGLGLREHPLTRWSLIGQESGHFPRRIGLRTDENADNGKAEPLIVANYSPIRNSISLP